MYQVEIKNSAKSDLKKLKRSHLVADFMRIIDQLEIDPFYPNQSLEKLTPPALGKYSRRINAQHRCVYTVDKTNRVVKIWSAWDHYRRGV